MPVDAEIAAMETFVEVMEPFVRITEIINGIGNMGHHLSYTSTAIQASLQPLTLISI